MSPANKSAAAPAPAPSSDSPLDGPISAEERWQLMLGADEELGGLRGSLQAMDRALGALYVLFSVSLNRANALPIGR